MSAKKKIVAKKITSSPSVHRCEKSGGEKKCKVAELMILMDKHQIVALELEEKDFKIKLQKTGGVAMNVAASSAIPMLHHAPAILPATSTASSANSPTTNQEDDPNLIPIKSPIVGTFYGAPSPEAAPFIAVGDKVTPVTIVCIIEAMKIMNEIKAELSGTVEKILVENGDPIEYGQPLFLVRK